MTVDDFVDYLNDAAGSALRVVAWYAAGDFGGLYVRDDLDRDAVIDRTQFIAEQLSGGGRATEATPLADLGDEQAMVQVRDHAVILRFPVAPDRGLVVSLDVEAARDLHEFVTACTSRLEGAELSFRSSALAV